MKIWADDIERPISSSGKTTVYEEAGKNIYYFIMSIKKIKIVYLIWLNLHTKCPIIIITSSFEYKMAPIWLTTICKTLMIDL